MDIYTEEERKQFELARSERNKSTDKKACKRRVDIEKKLEAMELKKQLSNCYD